MQKATRVAKGEVLWTWTEANKVRYKNMKNWVKKVVAKAMKEAADWELKELNEHLNKVIKLVKSMKKGWERC